MNDEIKIIADQLMQSGMEMDSAIDEAIRLSRQSTEEDLRLQDLEDQVMGRSRPYKRGERMLRLLDPSQDPLTGERNIRDFGRQKIANIIPGMTLIGREKVFQGHNPLYNLLQEANRVSKAYHGQDYLKELHHRVMQAGRGRVDKDFGYESSFADGGQVFASDTDKIAQKLIEQGLDRETAMAAALRMAQSRQQADQSILGGVPTQPPVSDVPPATEILGGDPSKLFQRQPTTMERVRDLPKDVLGAADAMASMGSLAALAVPSMLYALRPGQKTQGDPMEFALRNMYMPRSERGPSHLAGLGEVLESLPQTGPLPELQAFTGVGRGVGKQLEEKGKQIKKAKPNKAGQPSEAKKDGGTVNHKAVASARRALEKAMAKGGIAKAVGKAAAKAAVKTEQRGLDLERLKTTGIEVPEAGFSKEDKAVLRPLYNQGLIRVEERDGKKILVPGKGAWYEFATPEQRTRLDALQESQGVKDLSLMGPTESLLNSAQASFYDFEIVPGVRNVPIQSLEPLLPGYESAQEMKRIQNLAKQIKESKQIEPLFIGVDPTGIPYIMEGQHRIRALKSLGYEDVPARIVVDMDDVEKAAGGSVKMAGGGSVIGKAAAAAAKQARTVLSPAESQANLQKMLAESQIKERLYHGTTATEGGKGEEAIRRIKPSKEGSLGAGAYLTPKADFASSYAESTGGNVLPVYAQIKKPLIIEGKGDPMIEALIKLGMDEDKASRMVERAYENKGYIGKEVQLRALSQGYDGLMQYRNGDLAEVVVYNPNAIKSAIGNQGTYDITSPELSKAHGGLAHMAGGGSMLGTIAGRAAAAGKKSTQWAQEAAAAKRAPAKSKEEIEAIARRMAAQTQPGFVRASEEQSINPAGKSQLLYEMEQRTPMVVESTIADRPVPNVDYEQQLGKVIVGVPGDPTMGQVAVPGSLESPTRGGKQLVQVGDVRPETPVQLYGGPQYGANLDETFWASNLSPARAVQNLVQEMAQKYGAEQVLGKYIKMSPESSRFAMHNLDALISVLQPEKLDKDKVELLNNLVRKGNPKNKFPEFAGFEDPINVLLQAQMNSKLRKQISEVLEKPSVAKQVGFPFPGKVVQTAITEPELRNVETGVTGFAIGKMNPKGKLSFSSHPTYDYDIPGQAIGRSKYLIPSEMSFPDFTAWYRSRPDVQAKVDPINMMKSYGPRQVIDQQYIDEIKMYEEAMKRLTGKKKGGLMKKSSKLPKVIKSGKVGGLSALRK